MAFPLLYLLRHGETEWNAEGRFQGQNNAPLTTRGKQDAHAQGQLLEQVFAKHPRIAIYASPLGRVRQTVEIALASHDRKAQVDDRLMEINIGQWQGLTIPEIEAGWPEIFSAHATTFELLANAPDGENTAALFARCTQFLNGLSGPSVLFSHGATMAALRSIARGLPSADAGNLDRRQACIYQIQNTQEKIFE